MIAGLLACSLGLPGVALAQTNTGGGGGGGATTTQGGTAHIGTNSTNHGGGGGGAWGWLGLIGLAGLAGARRRTTAVDTGVGTSRR
jgi:MYXO-CTERM domain-containing protein